MAVHNYESANGCLPPAYVLGPDGRPWHSWRVLVLPHLGHQDIYDIYRFDEPWDGPNNRKLAGRIGNIFRRPEDERRGALTTSFVAVVGPETVFPGERPLRMEEIGDGTHNTIMFVEVSDSKIPWMEPRDLRFDRMSFRVNDPSGLGPGSPYPDVRAAFADGSVLRLKDDIRSDILRALLTTNGGEPIQRSGDGWVLGPAAKP